jgi:RHS repeat-associated protein
MSAICLAAALGIALLGHGSAATGATLDGPTTPILDDFNGRGLEDPLYQWGNWTPESIDGSGPTLEILGGAAAGHNEGFVEGDSYRPAVVTGDAEVHARLAAVPASNEPMYLYLHLGDVGGPGWDGYRLHIEQWVSSAADTVAIQKISDGAPTTLASVALGNPDLQAGDGFLLRRTGSTLELWRRNAGVWTQLLSASDAAYQSGRIGFGLAEGSGSWDDFGGSGPAPDPPPNLPVPATRILDDFERPNEDPLSQNGAWSPTSIFGSGQTLEVLAGSVGENEDYDVQANSFRTQELVGDAEVHARIASLPDNDQEHYLYLHLQDAGTAGVDGYRAHWYHWIVTDQLTIQKLVNGVPQTLAGPIGLEPATGDTLLLRRIGLVLELWREHAGTWTKLLSTLDSSYTSGRLGLGLRDVYGRWDDFGGGALDAPPPPPPPPSGVLPEQTYGAGENGRGMHGHSGSGLFADPVNSRTGAFTTSVDDLDLPGTGVSFAWSRSYTSADSTVERLGPGWTDSYSASLAVQPDGDVRLHGEDGQQLRYVKQPNGSFLGSPGSLSTLASAAGGYELLRPDQVTYRFTAQGRLLSIKDRNHQGVTLAYDGQGRLTSVTDAAGRQATISYNPQNLVSQVQTQDGRDVGYGYTAGRLTSVTDVRGKTWTYTYDAGGRLEKITDPLNHAQVTNVYGADGRVTSQTDALNKQTIFTWNEQTETATATDANQKAWTHDYEEGVLVKEVDPLQNETELVRDEDLNTTAVTGPTDETTEMTYDAAGNLLTAKAPPSLNNAQKTFVYNARNDVELVTDARGKVTDYAYNPTSGNLVSVTQHGTQVASYTYDAAGRVETFTDGNEKTWTYTYFPATGYLQSSTDPVGNKTTYTYDGAGRVATRIDPRGTIAGCNCAADFTWTYTYNDAGQLLTERNPLGHTTTNVYDDAGRLTSSTDALSRTTSYTYDDANRLRTETAPDPDAAGPLTAPVTTYTYDNVGNKLTETDPRGNTTTFAYDGSNRLTSTTGPDPDGAGPQPAPVTTNTYDPNGNLASTVGPRGNVRGANPDDFRTTFTYDAAGRMRTETRPDPDGAGPALPPKTTNVYDPVGNLASVTDGNNHTTSYSYYAVGRILTVTGPDLGVTTYTYDDAGNLLTRRDDNNHATSYAYDGAGRLVTETSPDPDGPGPQGPAVTSYSYDPNGNRLTVTDPNGNATGTAGDGVTTYGYDRANRETSIDYSDATPDVTFTYDAVGNRLTMADGSATETRTYDALDRLLAVTRSSNTFSYAYDASSNVTRRTYPGNTIVNYDYDPLNRLASVATASNTTRYGYDLASNLVQTTLPSGNGYVETRVYDRAGRLTEVENRRGGTVLSHFVSALDPVGNPTQVVRTGALAQTQSYAYDASDRITAVCFQAGTCPGASDPFIRWTYDKVGNRLTEQRPSGSTTYTYDARDRLLSAGSITFAYDQNGNQLQKASRTFTYDLANRLRTTRQGSTTTTYAYDGDGKRLQASTGSSSSSKTNFLWDVSFGLPQLARENNGSGSLQRRYVYGDRRISMTNNSNTTYYLYDPLGSVANMTSSGGSTRWTYAYEPFGTLRTEQRSGGSAPTNYMKFTGEYLDPTGLYHLRARQFDPSVGRFLRPDPVNPRFGASFVASYAYVADRPTVMADPSGLTFRSADLGVITSSFAGSAVNWQSPDDRCQSAQCGRRPSVGPRPSLVHPIPTGYAFTVCQGNHGTAGLAGYVAWDFCTDPNTPVLAVQSGVLYKWSGHNPQTFVDQTRGIFGWSLYLRADSGADYFYTHLGGRIPEPPSGERRVRAGQKIGRIGDWPGDRSRSHLHLGVSGGSVTIGMVGRAPRVRIGG